MLKENRAFSCFCLLAGLLFASLPGCGGGGSNLPDGSDPPGGAPPGGNEPPPDKPPVLAIDFPPLPALVDETAAPSLTIRGRASDDVELAAVRVGDVTAETGDGFANWRIEVPLQTGSNEITVVAVDTAGNESSRIVSIERVPFIPQALNGVVLDEANQRLYVTDYARDAVFSVNLSDGKAMLLSGAGKGAGPELSFPRDLVLDADDNRLIITAGGGKLVAVDIASGDRTLISGGGVGEGPAFTPSGIAFDTTDSNRVYVTSYANRALFAVSLDSGNRELLSRGDTDPAGDNSVGAGDPFVAPFDVVHDGQRLLVADNAYMVAVDPVTGNRTKLASLGNQATSLALDATGNRVIFGLDVMSGSIRQLDLDSNSNAVTVLSDAETGTGPQLLSTSGVTSIDKDGHIYAVDSTRNRIVSVDLANGNRALLPTPSIGDGEPFTQLQTVELDALNNRLLVTNRSDIDNVDVIAVDLGDGARKKLHDLDSGAGGPITAVVDTVLDSATGELWVLTGGDALFTVDMSTGERRLRSGDGTGSGPKFVGVSGLAVDFITQHAWVTDSAVDALFAVGLADGRREIVSDAERGEGPAFDVPGALVAGIDGERLFVPDVSVNTVVTVDAATGDRTDLASLRGDPYALVQDAGGLIVLTSYGLHRVDPDTGKVTLLSGKGEGDDVRGQGIDVDGGLAAYRMACDEERHVCYLANRRPGSIIAIDIVSGDRVMIAR